MNAASWLPEPGHESLTTRLRLVCCAHAGGDPVAFSAWAKALPRAVSLCPLRRPGRDPRSAHAALADVHIIAHQAVEALATLATRPSALFGHSLGAVIAFEIARLLEARGLPPRLLIVSGREAPQVSLGRPPIADLPDARFIAELDARYGGVPAEVRDSPELLARLLPSLRADLRAAERYHHRPGPALRCPLIVCQGRQDTSVDPSKLDGWRELSLGSFERVDFPGGHFFPFEPASGFSTWLGEELRVRLGGSRRDGATK
ncbi:Linear gramicidin dehydrogenase LgrE [Enhygromyxa salina]|uniref:Linear gramicidin dehydrogenase LgrE n=1 Tax=Enhygromyxa salina TaxID=215803 RepID=A0A2S9YGB8_9BACT|nr:alpha/beta fold hydrolase [Enhygromyxa salina]PRQ04160.1 Linear gramicidin dehydrogenase LgrE [Enhygromyxa salina]